MYLLITMGIDDPDALENFSQQDIAIDTAGCKTFVDAWGRPIQFLRRAPGFISNLQPDGPTVAGQSDQRMRDQTDPMGFYGSPLPGSVDPAKIASGAPNGLVGRNTFALYPLIYSGGPDGIYDTVPDLPNSTANSSPQGEKVAGQPTFSCAKANSPNDPYISISNSLPNGDFKDGPIAQQRFIQGMTVLR